ncbi:hypothetical protein [Actinomarinicola tropica]|uniref:SRPBCC family protein n=1 Tax=Actinomarinicola tropica TaxID=2789776 RepID=A0A5Q2RP36_9ACTN|nr:hypothetical protein [Actinomarinicola tropica]QGG96712.1 hypothetical protein GH723_17305 [Actinomarinicola tropica]
MSRAPIDLTFTTDLDSSAEAVWSVVATMPGVNAELGPWVRMTHPRGLGRIDEVEVVPGAPLFSSWLLLLGIVPIDRHRLVLDRVLARGFDEDSTSWLQRRWRHERRVEDRPGGGCVVTDRLVVVPRVGPAAPLVRRIVAAVFAHRHRRLRRRFGTPGSPAS